MASIFRASSIQRPMQLTECNSPGACFLPVRVRLSIREQSMFNAQQREIEQWAYNYRSIEFFFENCPESRTALQDLRRFLDDLMTEFRHGTMLSAEVSQKKDRYIANCHEPSDMVLAFENERDAVEFKLRWF